VSTKRDMGKKLLKDVIVIRGTAKVMKPILLPNEIRIPRVYENLNMGLLIAQEVS